MAMALARVALLVCSVLLIVSPALSLPALGTTLLICVDIALMMIITRSSEAE
ncbi:hypothetical protein ABZ777_32470 [Micromonospora parva]|uniref:hypothetical protein n=1 Tax=Micromonospora parva TaxID=1464048 RepID=UPI0033FA0DCC